MQISRTTSVKRKNGDVYLIEVKSAWKEDDPVVNAKREAAEQLAAENKFYYSLLTKEDFAGFLAENEGWRNYSRSILDSNLIGI